MTQKFSYRVSTIGNDSHMHSHLHWLRFSLSKTDPNHHKHREWLRHRNYVSTDVELVIVGDIHAVDVDIWLTNVVVERGGEIALETSSGDT